MLVKSLEISSDAQMAGMRAAHPGAYEYEVKAAIEAVHRARGAVSWSYPSIVGSGPNATILHYPVSDRQMQAGDLLLVDAACNYEYMSGDITRTYPVSGTFSPDAEGYLRHRACRRRRKASAAAKPGAVAGRHPQQDRRGDQGRAAEARADHRRQRRPVPAVVHARRVALHRHRRARRRRHAAAARAGHGVHDRAGHLHPPERARRAAAHAENVALIAKVQPVVDKYADLGIRVEDSFLLEASGLRRLSASVPRTIDEIEAFMRTRHPASAAAR